MAEMPLWPHSSRKSAALTYALSRWQSRALKSRKTTTSKQARCSKMNSRKSDGPRIPPPSPRFTSSLLHRAYCQPGWSTNTPLIGNLDLRRMPSL